MRLWMWNNAQLCINIDTITTIKKQSVRIHTMEVAEEYEFIIWTTDNRATILNPEEYTSLMEFIKRGGIK
jgi:hypothetical protein